MSEPSEVIRFAPTARPYLLYVRSGKEPVHDRWLDHAKPRSWDLAISYYDVPATGPDMRAEIVMRGGFSKLTTFADLSDLHPELLDSYQAVLLFDDDLATHHASIDTLFMIAAQYNLAIAQAALTHVSPHSFLITLSHPTFLLRYTNYVEVMMPLFSAAALRTCLPTFRENASGWGVEMVWPALLGWPEDSIAVIDRVLVRHTRPIDLQNGMFYTKLRQRGINPHREKQEILLKHGVKEDLKTYGGILENKGVIRRILFSIYLGLVMSGMAGADMVDMVFA